MTFSLEISRPFQWRPGWFRSRWMVRAYWLWFAASISFATLSQLVESDLRWVTTGGRP